MNVDELSAWWLKNDAIHHEKSAEIIKQRKLDEATAHDWNAKGRLEKNLRKCGFKPLDASKFRVLLEQVKSQEFIMLQEDIDVTKLNDTEIAHVILKTDDFHKLVDLLAALRRHAYAQGFAAK